MSVYDVGEFLVSMAVVFAFAYAAVFGSIRVRDRHRKLAQGNLSETELRAHATVQTVAMTTAIVCGGLLTITAGTKFLGW